MRENELAAQRSSRLTPLAAALIAAATALIGAIAGALLQGRANLALERSKHEFSKEIERQKLDSSLIVQAVSTGRQDDSIRNLRFLVRLNIISGEALRKNLTELLDKTPEQTAVLPAASSDDLVKLGVDRARQGRWMEAIDFYEKALKQNPRDPVALNYLGYVLLGIGQTAAAIAKLEQSVENDPKYTWGYYNLSLAYFKANRDQDGIATVQRLLSLDPTFRGRIKDDEQFQPFLEAQPALRSLVGESSQR